LTRKLLIKSGNIGIWIELFSYSLFDKLTALKFIADG